MIPSPPPRTKSTMLDSKVLNCKNPTGTDGAYCNCSGVMVNVICNPTKRNIMEDTIPMAGPDAAKLKSVSRFLGDVLILF